jgi:hypothetical protein
MVNNKVAFTTSSTKTLFSNPPGSQPSALPPQTAISGDFSSNPDLDPSSSSPITRETSHSGSIFRFLLFLAVVLAAMYFFLHRR